MSRINMPQSSFKKASFEEPERPNDDQGQSFEYGINWDSAMGDDEMHDLNFDDTSMVDDCRSGDAEMQLEILDVEQTLGPADVGQSKCPVCEKPFSGLCQTVRMLI